MAEEEFSAWRSLEAELLGADGHATIRPHFDGSAYAPDKGPPRAAWFGAQDGAFLLACQVPGLLGFHFEFAVDFMPVMVEPQVLDMRISLVQIRDLFAGEEGGQALLPEEVGAFDFALGLGSRSIAEGDAVEVKGLAQLGKSVWGMGKEQAMKVHIDFQRQAIFHKGGGQQIEIGQQRFALINFGTGQDPAAIVEHVDHGKGLGAVGEPAVGRGIELPQFTDLAALPAPDRSGRAAIGSGVGQVVLDGPTADLGAIDFELAVAEPLAGREAGGGWWFALEPFVQERLDLIGPRAGMITSGKWRRPSGLLVIGTGLEVVTVKLVEAAAGKAQSGGGNFDFESAGAESSQQMTD